MAAIPIPGVNTPTYQSWGAAVAGKLNQVAWARVTGTTDPSGRFDVLNSALGLTIAGGVASHDAIAAGGVLYGATAFKPVAGGAHVYIVGWNAVSNDIEFLMNTPTALFVIAWGTPL